MYNKTLRKYVGSLEEVSSYNKSIITTLDIVGDVNTWKASAVLPLMSN